MINGLELTRADETSMPRLIKVTYVDEGRDDQSGTQTAGPLSIDSVGETSVTLPLRLSATEAKQIADVLLNTAHSSRVTAKFKLPISYLSVEIGDVLQLVGKDSSTYRLKVSNITFGALTIEIEAVFIPDGYTSSAVGDSGDVGNQTIVTKGGTRIRLLDLPAISPTDGSNPIIYFGLDGIKSGWNGASVSGTTYGSPSLVGGYSEEIIYGTSLTRLGDWENCGEFDFVNNVEVQLYQGELVSRTLDEILANKYVNLLVIGAGNSSDGYPAQVSCFELVQFTNATLIGDKKYKVSGLLRGRFGTEHFAKPLVNNGVTQWDAHSVGDLVVLVNSAVKSTGVAQAIKDVNLVINTSNNAEVFKGDSVTLTATTFSTSYSETGSSSTVECGVRPRSLSQVNAVRTANGIVFSFQRRVGNGIAFFNPVETYNIEIRVRNTTSFSPVVRTVQLTAGETSWTYTNAMQTQDGLSGTQQQFDLYAYSTIGGYSKAVTVSASKTI